MKNINSRELLLKCALALFSEKGYECSGINEIVQMAGVTKPTLYYFFQSKEGIFKEICRQYYERFNTILAKESEYIPNTEAYENDVYPVLLRIVNAYFSFAGENRQFYMMILALTFAPPTAQTANMIEPYHRTQYQIIIRCFEHMSEVHTNFKGREQQYAYHFVAMINANIGFWNHGYVAIDGQNADNIVRQFMHGIFS